MPTSTIVTKTPISKFNVNTNMALIHLLKEQEERALSYTELKQLDRLLLIAKGEVIEKIEEKREEGDFR